jgi:hypothetical protein
MDYEETEADDQVNDLDILSDSISKRAVNALQHDKSDTNKFKLVRQVFTARKAQMPRWWVDFSELRSKIIASSTHCIVAIRISDIPK